jgi:hypothetical protein
MQLELAHFKRRGVHVPHEITNEAAVLLDPLRANSIGDAGTLNDRGIVAHVVKDSYEAIVEDTERHAENVVERSNTWPRETIWPVLALRLIIHGWIFLIMRRRGRLHDVTLSGSSATSTPVKERSVGRMRSHVALPVAELFWGTL